MLISIVVWRNEIRNYLWNSIRDTFFAPRVAVAETIRGSWIIKVATCESIGLKMRLQVKFDIRLIIDFFKLLSRFRNLAICSGVASRSSGYSRIDFTRYYQGNAEYNTKIILEYIL